MKDENEMQPVQDVLKEAMEWIMTMREVLPEKKETYIKTLLSFRDYYNSVEKEIMSLAAKDRFKWAQSYPMDLKSIFTPIEENVWEIIRYTGRIVLYPQFPIGNYFADFANPYLKIAVEVDGKEFHKDKEKDRGRDEQLHKLGWKVFRISGAESYSNIQRGDGVEEDEGNYEQFYEWLLNSAEGVIWAIRHMFFETMGIDYEHIGKVIQTLEKHSYFYKYK